MANGLTLLCAAAAALCICAMAQSEAMDSSLSSMDESVDWNQTGECRRSVALAAALFRGQLCPGFSRWLAVVATSNDGTGRIDGGRSSSCEVWGWGSNRYKELLQSGGRVFTRPVRMNMGSLSAGRIRSIQGGATASSFGMAVTCTPAVTQ
jgi:hypothetical protein